MQKASENEMRVIGRTGSDVEIRYTGKGTAVCQLSIATTDSRKDSNGEIQEKTTWHKATLWGKKAELAQKWISKGTLVLVKGPMEYREWENREGVKMISPEINCQTITILAKGANPTQGGQGGSAPPPQQSAPYPTQGGGGGFEDDEPLPF
jgi:single-strand DNA-binding protein